MPASVVSERNGVWVRHPVHRIDGPTPGAEQHGRCGRSRRDAAQCWRATRAQGIRWREELVFVLGASELGIAWIVGLYALPALGLHATAIDPLGDLVFGLGVLNTLAVV